MTEAIKTVEEYIAWTKAQQGGLLLYRGLPDADWEVESSAYRRIGKSRDMSSETVPAVTFQSYIDHLLDEAGLRGFRERRDRSLSDLELLAELQHFGAATCLIDFTTHSLIALWFACHKEAGKASKVVALATDDPEKFSSINYEDSKKPIKEFLNRGKLWKWEPSGLNNRIVAQQSVFVFGEGRIEKNSYQEITIAATHKNEIIRILGKAFGISERKLYNDLAGFANNNAHDQPYDKLTAEDFLSLGATLHQQGEFQQAIESYGRAIELDSELDTAYYSRGTAKNSLSDHLGAITDLDKAIERNPQNAAAYNNRGTAKSALGDYLGAIADYESAIRLNPQEAASYYSRGYAKSALGDYLGAIADYDSAIKLNPQEAANYYSRGYARHALGDYLGAIADYDIAIELNPHLTGSYNIRGNAKSALGDYLGAIADYDRVIDLYPQDSAAYFNRANAKRASDDLQGAIIDFGNAIELNPQNAAAHHYRAIVRRELGDEVGAKRDFSRAVEIDPGLHTPVS